MFYKFDIDVPNNIEPVRLDRYLKKFAENSDEEILNQLSRSYIQKLIEEKNILLNSLETRASNKLLGGEKIIIRLPEIQSLKLIPEPMDLDILFEDKDLIIINKPSGLVVHPGAGHKTGTLVHALLAHCKNLSGISGVMRPGIVHRLDKGTSGVMVIAKNDLSHINLSQQFSNRQVEKKYIAFVFGVPKKSSGVIDTLYGRHKVNRKLFSSQVKKGKKAITHYKVVRSGNKLSEIYISLETGRTHQIRVHFKDMGYPLVKDPIYSKLSTCKKYKKTIQVCMDKLEYQALHAEKLCILHPRSHQKIVCKAPLPKKLLDLRACILDQYVVE